MNKYPNLTSPIKIGKVTFRNRIFSAPMGATDITADCCPGPRTQGFYELRAKGGAAAVTVSELVVHPDTDGSHMLHLDLETVGCLAAHTFVADAIRRHGAVPSIELSHSGQYAGTYMSDKNKKASLNQWGPSDGTRPDGRPVKALSKEQIEIKQNQLTAEVERKADAEKYKTEKDAQAALETGKRKAEAYAIREKGKAEAEATAARLTAEAEGMDKKAEAFKKYNDAAITQMIVEQLPGMAESIAKSIAGVGSINIYSTNGGSGLESVAGSVPVMIKQVMDTVKSATGVDMAGVIKAGSIEAQTDRNINVTGIPGGAPATSTQGE